MGAVPIDPRGAQFMARALELARRGEGRTSPNPPVGALLVRDGVIFGEGFHPAAGEPHAEIFALRDAGERARDADLYVTLEPCCHQGRTGPCAEALIAAGVRRVFYGVVDPNPRVAGQGLARLRAAGIEVAVSPLADECRRLIAPFSKQIKTGRPYLILKAAMTLDGQLATSTGESQWISCEESRLRVHRLRDRVDAILTGSGTVLADDPQLTVRLPEGGRNPARVVIDGGLRTSVSARVFDPEVAGRRLLVTAADVAGDRRAAYAGHGVEVLSVPRVAGRLDLGATLDALGAAGLQSVLVEAGGTLNGALLRAGLIDAVMLFVAPKLMGGNDGRPLFAGAGVAQLGDVITLDEVRVVQVGSDWLFEGEVGPCSPA